MGFGLEPEEPFVPLAQSFLVDVLDWTAYQIHSRFLAVPGTPACCLDSIPSDAWTMIAHQESAGIAGPEPSQEDNTMFGAAHGLSLAALAGLMYEAYIFSVEPTWATAPRSSWGAQAPGRRSIQSDVFSSAGIFALMLRLLNTKDLTTPQAGRPKAYVTPSTVARTPSTATSACCLYPRLINKTCPRQGSLT
ncbi:hypothetical protein LY76DRAFT_83582 [Colletotrichum caudatum]|nr:hypothetical protein LY76DRAFT_83582 [Colletotrichum caudatum]